MNIEARLTELIGEPGRKLHTARSRNDQVATDLRLWVRDAIDRTDGLLQDLQAALLGARRGARGRRDAGLHPSAGGAAGDARPSSAGLCRDVRARSRPLRRRPRAPQRMPARRRGARRHELPDRSRTRPPRRSASSAHAANSIDAVSDRDFALEFLAAAAIAAIHLSRLAEELVLWSTPQFGFVRMAEEFSSGSSIMPQKRNPDAAELVRGKAGRVIGGLTALLIVLKGLPLAYGKDLQEDKEPVFDAADSSGPLPGRDGRYDQRHDLRPRAPRRPPPRSATRPRPISPTGWCARWACRSAPPIGVAAPGGAPRRGARASASAALQLEDLQAIEPRITREVFEVLSVERSVASRTSFGGTAPARVREAIAGGAGSAFCEAAIACCWRCCCGALVLGGCSLGGQAAFRRRLAGDRTWRWRWSAVMSDSRSTEPVRLSTGGRAIAAAAAARVCSLRSPPAARRARCACRGRRRRGRREE